MAELLVSIDDVTMIPRLRRVIRSLYGVNKVSVPRRRGVRSVTYRHQLARLNELAKLEKDWDEDGASPIESQVVAISDRYLICHQTLSYHHGCCSLTLMGPYS